MAKKKHMTINFAVLDAYRAVLTVETESIPGGADEEPSRQVTVSLLRDGSAVCSATEVDPASPASLVRTLATRLAQDDTFRFDAGGTALRFDGAAWREAEDEIHGYGGALKAVLGVEHSLRFDQRGFGRDVWIASRSLFPMKPDAFSTFGRCPGVPCADGVLVWNGAMKRFDVHEHQPEYRNLFSLPVRCEDALANMREPQGGLLRKYLTESVTIDDAAFLKRWCGLHLVQHTVPQRVAEYFLLLQGDGGNGKSAIIDLITGLVGAAAVATKSLDELCEGNTHELVGKVAMVSPENKGVWDLKLLNRLVSNEILPSRKLWSDWTTVRPQLLLTQACNKPPVFNEKSRALERRMLVMHLTKTFDKSKGVVQDIGQRIAKEEYAELVGWALLGAAEILEAGKLEVPASLQEQGKVMARNGVQMEEFAALLEFGEYAVSKKELLALYLRWVDDENRGKITMSIGSIVEELHRIAARDHGPIYIGANQIPKGVQRLAANGDYAQRVLFANKAAGRVEQVAGGKLDTLRGSPLHDAKGASIRFAKREDIIYGVRIRKHVVDEYAVGVEWTGGPDGREANGKPVLVEQAALITAPEAERIAELEAELARLKAVAR